MAVSETPVPVFYGRYSDGKTAQAANADVRLGTRGVEILLSGRATAIIWPYATLATAEPMTDHAIDALLSSTSEPGASLFVGEGSFARRLTQLAPQLSARSQRWRHAKPWVYATCATAAVAVAVWVLDLSPSRAIARMLPDTARMALGEQVIESMTDGRRVCDAPAGREALDKLIDRLSKAAAGSRRFKVVVVDWGLLNAFAAPGEQIVLTRGLITKAESADEVAGVLAHEMGHGIEMHPETGIVRAIGLSAATDLVLGGSGGTVANIGLVLAQLSYTRSAEREADHHALGILKKAGIAASGLADFFRRVIKIEDSDPIAKNLPGINILRTHPDTEERMAAVVREPPYAATPSLTASEWAALKGICGPAKDNKNGHGKDAGERDI